MTLDEAFAGLKDARTGPALRHDLQNQYKTSISSITSSITRDRQHNQGQHNHNQGQTTISRVPTPSTPLGPSRLRAW